MVSPARWPHHLRLRGLSAQPIVRRMMEKASAAGWVVQLTIPGVLVVQPEGAKWRPAVTTAPTFQFFNVAIVSADKAIGAARKKLGASAEAALSVVRALSPAEIDHLKLKAGEAEPA